MIQSDPDSIWGHNRSNVCAVNPWILAPCQADLVTSLLPGGPSERPLFLLVLGHGGIQVGVIHLERNNRCIKLGSYYVLRNVMGFFSHLVWMQVILTKREHQPPLASYQEWQKIVKALCWGELIGLLPNFISNLCGTFVAQRHYHKLYFILDDYAVD